MTTPAATPLEEIITMTHTTPTLAEIAADYALWGKYFDVDGLDSPEQWEALGQAARVQMLREAFGPPTICDQCGRNSHDERGDGACGHCA